MNSEFYKRIVSSIILILSSIYIIMAGGIIFNFLILIVLLLSIYEWKNICKKKKLYYLGISFLFFAFYAMYKIRNDFNGEYYYLFFVLLICVSTDIGGYIFGKVLKGPKLTDISPNKTYSGVAGSYIFSIFSAYLYIQKVELDYAMNNISEVIFIVILISTVSQLGDLLISFFKRMSNLKDTGTIIPGHGGVLDRIDGMIFAIPFSYLIFSFNIFQL